jgi:hypothetical protein
MKDRYVSCVRFLVLALLLALSSTPAFAQASSTSSLSGTVVDADGGVIPGATVVVKNNATGVAIEAVTNSTGQYSFPGLNAGTYTVTVSLAGFKTFVANDVRLISSTPASVNAKLEVGALTDVIEVKARSEMVQTQSPTISSTLLAEQLTELPLVSRNALYSLTMLPGVSAASNNLRNSVINGLPNNTVNITIDGIGTGNALQSTDGFFSMVTPRMDAVEEVTVTGAVPGVGAGAGSVQIAFVTRSGSNQFDSSAYLYWRDPKFNSNYFFNEINNLPKNEAKLRTWGARVGGPVVLPGYNGRGKAFFFLNYEHQHLPSSATRTRTILNPDAYKGIFTYDRVVNGQTIQQQVDLLAMARANGQIYATDPTVMSMIALIKSTTEAAAANGTGAINTTTNRNLQQFVFQSEAIGDQYAPTARLDYQLTDKHRITASGYVQRFVSTADLLNNRDVQFPGMPNFASQNSWRTTGSLSLRSTLSSNMVNEFKGGFQHSPNDFFAKTQKESFANMGGYAIVLPLVTDIWSTNDPAPRNTPTWSVNNDLSWLRGAHSFTFGGSFSSVLNRQNGYNLVPELDMGFDTTNDPASYLFNQTCTAPAGAPACAESSYFPGASAANLTTARSLYALMTGRITSIPGTARLDAATGKYVYLGDLATKAKQHSFAAYASDSWRVRPTLTINGGLRWDVQLPFTPVTDTFSTATLEDICGISGVGTGPGGRGCNMFQSAIRTGKAQPTYTRYDVGEASYKTNWKNIGYNAGFAWRPNVQGGFLRSILGDPEQATVRGGYSLTYNVERIDRFNAGNNPGGEINVSKNNTTSPYCLVCPGDGLGFPALISQTSRLGAPSFPESPVYPILASTANRMDIMSADLRTPRVQSYSVGFQRSLGQDMALEVRYVGNRSKYTWGNENWNERTIFENGFYDEFLLARANLAANRAAGKGNTFAYTGAPGTSPLPIHQAYLAGRNDPTNVAGYTGVSQYTNSAFLNRLSIYEPEVGNAAAAIDTTAFRANALKAGFAPNFFVMNPSVSSANVMNDGGGTKYNSIQTELRRRLSKGLLVSANYTYARQYVLSLQTLRLDRFQVNDTRQPHEFKMNFTYEVPVGRGRRFGTDMNPILNGILGNWEFSGNARVQTSRFRITNAKLVGMTADELSREFRIRVYKDIATGTTTVYSMPADIILNTRAAYSTDPTQANGYSAALGAPTGRYIKPSSDASCVAVYRGDCNAPDIEINGPLYKKVDLRIKKLFPFLGRGSFEVNIEALNAFANINFNHNLTPGEGAGTFQVTTAATDISTSGDPGGRVGQIVFRINW